MYQKIKELADAAVKLQNKIAMENTLKEISAMCAPKEKIESGEFNHCSHGVSMTTTKEEIELSNSDVANATKEGKIVKSKSSVIETVADGETLEVSEIVVKTNNGIKKAGGLKK